MLGGYGTYEAHPKVSVPMEGTLNLTKIAVCKRKMSKEKVRQYVA